MNNKELRASYRSKKELRAWYDSIFPGSVKTIDRLLQDEAQKQNERMINGNSFWTQMPNKSLSDFIPYSALCQLKYLIDGTLDRDFGKGVRPKLAAVDQFLAQFGFYPSGKGTSRSAYFHAVDPWVILKLGRDTQGKRDNTREYLLQYSLKPNCAKVFDCTADGLVQLCERTLVCNLSMYIENLHRILTIIMGMLKRGYIMDDIGGKFFMNWGIRNSYGPVIIDFAETYKADPAKLICRIPDSYGGICGGKLNYDVNTAASQIICMKCGSRYLAADLAQSEENIKRENQYIVRGDINNSLSELIHFTIREGDKVIYTDMNEVVKK